MQKNRPDGIKKQLYRHNSRIILGMMGFMFFTGCLIYALGMGIHYNNTRNQEMQALVTLVNNNSLALKELAADYAITSIQELVSSTVRMDRDIIYGILKEIKHDKQK